jgi:putative hydrolase of the HAD superfamily
MNRPDSPGATAPPPTPVGMSPEARARLDAVKVWLFDMDNTLYPARVNLFGQIDRKMEAFVANLLEVGRDEARRLQKRYFHEHGTTLKGLMLSHGVDPYAFLNDVHDIDMSVLAPDPRLAAALARLPGRKLVFTNGDAPYAERVLAALGIRDAFEALFDIHAMGYQPKPDPRAYALLCERHAIDPERAFFADDMALNLRPAHALGMVTAWIDNGSERGNHGHSPDFIDHEIGELADWLEELTA